MKQLCHPHSDEKRKTSGSQREGKRVLCWAVYAAVMICIRTLEIIAGRAMMVRLLLDTLGTQELNAQTLGIRKSQGTSAVSRSVVSTRVF